MQILGLSLDSTDDKTNQEIGRADRRLAVLSLPQAIRAISEGRRTNRHLRLKINTVVNALNWRSDMNQAILGLAPEKWKVLRMLPTITDDLAVSASEFAAFIRRHRTLEHLIQAEDNCEMAQSYIMLDPHGRFFQNALGRVGYDYSAPVLVVGAAQALAQITVSSRKYCSRYANVVVGKPAS